MKCPKCGGPTRTAVNLYLDIPGSLNNRLNKAALRRKDVRVMGAGWPTALHYCLRMRCGWIMRLGSK